MYMLHNKLHRDDLITSSMDPTGSWKVYIYNIDQCYSEGWAWQSIEPGHPDWKGDIPPYKMKYWREYYLAKCIEKHFGEIKTHGSKSRGQVK